MKIVDICFKLALACLLLSFRPGFAQEALHSPHLHPYSREAMRAQNEGTDLYAGWKNRNNGDCCHGVHCKPLEASRVRQNGRGTEIQIDGDWCPGGHERLKVVPGRTRTKRISYCRDNWFFNERKLRTHTRTLTAFE
jgi:hypothetical protein